ncbi:MAG: IPTL-CTERM sorting domain-containing protein [Pseudomonadota bacterium]
MSGSIPANSPWGLALMALLLALLGGAALRRRRDAMG